MTICKVIWGYTRKKYPYQYKTIYWKCAKKNYSMQQKWICLISDALFWLSYWNLFLSKLHTWECSCFDRFGTIAWHAIRSPSRGVDGAQCCCAFGWLIWTISLFIRQLNFCLVSGDYVRERYWRICERLILEDSDERVRNLRVEWSTSKLFKLIWEQPNGM